jgi:hypothetical protein
MIVTARIIIIIAAWLVRYYYGRSPLSFKSVQLLQ